MKTIEFLALAVIIICRGFTVDAQTWTQTSVPSAYWDAGIIARLCAFIIGRVPVGYEDETGFHFGVRFKPSY